MSKNSRRIIARISPQLGGVGLGRLKPSARPALVAVGVRRASVGGAIQAASTASPPDDASRSSGDFSARGAFERCRRIRRNLGFATARSSRSWSGQLRAPAPRLSSRDSRYGEHRWLASAGPLGVLPQGATTGSQAVRACTKCRTAAAALSNGRLLSLPVAQFAQSLPKTEITGGATLTPSNGSPSRLTIDALTTAAPHPPRDM
jgi:hypothetical protein